MVWLESCSKFNRILEIAALKYMPVCLYVFSYKLLAESLISFLLMNSVSHITMHAIV